MWISVPHFLAIEMRDSCNLSLKNLAWATTCQSTLLLHLFIIIIRQEERWSPGELFVLLQEGRQWRQGGGLGALLLLLRQAEQQQRSPTELLIFLQGPVYRPTGLDMQTILNIYRGYRILWLSACDTFVCMFHQFPTLCFELEQIWDHIYNIIVY